jgi:hypothetical protein
MDRRVPITSEVRGLAFTFYAPEEVRRISVKQLSNQVMFDTLGNPQEGGMLSCPCPLSSFFLLAAFVALIPCKGLYDPCLGTTDRNGAYVAWSLLLLTLLSGARHAR